MKSILCDSCGKEMFSESLDFSLVGVEMSCKIPPRDDGQDEERKDFVAKQFGKYEPGRVYRFCWECWFDSYFSGLDVAKKEEE